MSSSLPRSHGEAPLRGALKREPEDFVVTERLGYIADGDGPHWLLEVRKRGTNTDWLARELARYAGVDARDVGYAGLKDRHAVTTQAYSVPVPVRGEVDWAGFACDGVEILSVQRHRKKIKRGALAGNAFSILLRDAEGDRPRADAVLDSISRLGVPNYFGEQRFGRGGANVDRARGMMAGRRVDRHTRSLLLSAARSELFNAVLAQRVSDGSWSHGIDGEVWCLSGSRSWFRDDGSTELPERLAHGDIHPSGPLWGRGELPSTGDCAALERRIIDQDSELAIGLEKAGMEQDRRALRLMPSELSWSWAAEGLRVCFVLPAGTYATVVMRELAADAES